MSNAMGLDPEFIQKNYERMSDRELLFLAANEANELTSEAMIILKKEIGKRKLDENIYKAIEIQSKGVSEKDFQYYIGLVRDLPCPVCASKNYKLNGALYAEAVSAIVFSTLTVRLGIACPPCLDRIVRKARRKTALLGWWSFPDGIIKTPKALAINESSLSQNHQHTPTESLKGYVLKKIGEIELYKGSEAELLKIITYTG